MKPQEVSLFLGTCQNLCPEHHPFFLCHLIPGSNREAVNRLDAS